MICGIKSMNAVVDVEHLISRLDIERPYSPTYGDVRDLRPFSTTYKGLHLFILPHPHEPNRYSVRLRGSLAKFFNGGRHNHSFLNPYDMLHVLDELAIDLRVNLFETELNNLEVMSTVRVPDAEAIIRNALGYLGVSVQRKQMEGGLLYADLQASQHRLKLYEPTSGLLRVEVHADRMAYFGSNRPNTLADLALPQFAEPMAIKLLDAFGKVVWDCADLNPDTLPPEEGYLLAKGRNPTYWHVDRKKYDRAEYDRVRKQRERERLKFDAIVQRHRTARSTTPADVSRKMQQQLTAYLDLMHTGLYERTLRTYAERWQIVANLPTWAIPPKLPKTGQMSQFYTSLIDRPATPQRRANPQHRPTAKELAEQPERVARILDGLKPRCRQSERCPETEVEKAHHRLRNMDSNERNNALHWLRKKVNAPEGLGFSDDEITAILSPKGRAALAYNQLALADLKHQRILPAKPLFRALPD